MNRKLLQREVRMNFALSMAEQFTLDSLRAQTGRSKGALLREGIRLVEAKYAVPRKRPPKDRRPHE